MIGLVSHNRFEMRSRTAGVWNPFQVTAWAPADCAIRVLQDSQLAALAILAI
jgi:hypothetical protein